MDAAFRSRRIFYSLLLVAWALTMLPNLGRVSLWDIDEGLNAEAAREMHESGDWVVPRFNFQLRDAKPALQYWCQAWAYRLVGVSEFGARLPSAVAALLAAGAVYELGRSMFSASVGGLAGLALVSGGLVVALGRFANPDALLLACTSLTFLAFWWGYSPRAPGGATRHLWFVPFGVACGLATLAKGPVGLLLPSLAVWLFLIWQRDVRNLRHRGLLWGIAAYALVTLPWYLMVTIETRGEFARGFFLKNNVQRYLSADHSHHGSLFYHALFLLVGFAPWSVWILPTLSCAWRDRGADSRCGSESAAVRLLLVWLGAYLLFFSLSATKLPGYGLPMYPAVALLTGRFLDGWRRGVYRPPRGLMLYSAAWLVLIGAIVSAGFALSSGRVGISQTRFRPVPALADLIPLGAVFAAVGGTVILLAWRGLRTAAVVSLVVGCVAGVAAFAGWTLPRFDSVKAPRPLIAAVGLHRRDQEWRLASYLYFQPSLVFYSQREVQRFDDARLAIEHLAVPTPAILFLTRTNWEALKSRLPGRVLAQAWDMYQQDEIVAVGNESACRSLDLPAVARGEVKRRP